MSVEWGKTERGFEYTEIPFSDYGNTPTRVMQVQESSLATERKLWLGPDTIMVDLNGNGEKHIMTRAHLGEDEVRQLRDALTDWLGDAPNLAQEYIDQNQR